MMKSGYRHFLRPGQRGAWGHLPPEPIPELAELADQAEQLESRMRQLRTGINNLMQLHPIQSSSSPAADHQLTQAELTHLEKTVEDFEIELASRLLTWQHLREPFWQALRYGGLGLVGGWFLHWLLQPG